LKIKGEREKGEKGKKVACPLFGKGKKKRGGILLPSLNIYSSVSS